MEELVHWYTGTWAPMTYLLPGVTATSAVKLPGTCSRVPDVPVAKVEDLWTDMDRCTSVPKPQAEKLR